MTMVSGAAAPRYNEGGSFMDVFLSHSREMTQFAKDLSKALQKQGISTWLDSTGLRSLSLGSKRAAVKSALREARGIVFLVDAGHRSNPNWDWPEALEAAWEQPRKALIPVLLEGAELPPFLRDRQAVRGSGDAEDLAPKIAKALSGNTGRVKSLFAQEKAKRQARLRELTQQVLSLKDANLL